MKVFVFKCPNILLGNNYLPVGPRAHWPLQDLYNTSLKHQTQQIPQLFHTPYYCLNKMCVHQLFVPQTFLNKIVHTPALSAGCYLCHSAIHKHSFSEHVYKLHQQSASKVSFKLMRNFYKTPLLRHHRHFSSIWFQWNSTCILMQMLHSDWLSHCTLSAIRVQWLEVVYETATFSRLAKGENFDANEN